MRTIDPRARIAAPALLAAALCFVASTASADPTKDDCINADTKAQSLKRDGKITASREQLRICASATCPALVRDDCAQRLDDVDRIQPTVVFEASDGAGHDLVAVTVTVDGQPWLDHLDGTAVPVDPGPHSFTFSSPGHTPVAAQYVVHEGEKARRERVVLGVSPAAAGAAAAPAPAPAGAPAPATGGASNASSAPPAATAPAPAAPASSRGRGQRIAGLAIGGVGVAGLVVGSIFGASALSSWNAAQNLCKPGDCSSGTRDQAQSDHDKASSAATISTVAFVAGGVLVAGGIVLFLTAPSAPKSMGLWISPAVGAGGPGVRLGGDF